MQLVVRLQRDNNQTMTLGSEENDRGVSAERDRLIKLWLRISGEVT